MSKFESTNLNEVKRWLDEQGIRYTQPTEYHIKVGPYNFYPEKKGTITLDGQKAVHPERGFEAFKKLVLKLKSRNAKAIQPMTSPSRTDERDATDHKRGPPAIDIPYN